MSSKPKSSWSVVSFGDIAQNIVERADPAHTDADVYVGLEHLDSDTLHLHRWGRPADVIGEKLVFKKGDIIFGKRRAYQRKLALAEFDGICSAHAMVLRPKPERVWPDFFPFFLQSDVFMNRAIEISVGSLSPTINWGTLRIQEFTLPPIEEQKRIVEVLWAADDVLEDWISCYDDMRRLSHVFAVESFRLREARKSRPNIPDKWKTGPLTELATVDPQMPRELKDDLVVSFVRMESVLETGGISEKESKLLRDVRNGYTYFGEGDILFAKITPCMENGKGAAAEGLTNEVGMGSTEFFVLRTRMASDRNFVYYLIMSRTYREIAERWMQGSAGQRRVPRDFFAKRPIVIPPAAERERLGRLMQLVNTTTNDVLEHVQLMRSIQRTLLNTVLAASAVSEVADV
jgi:type I restriction enzyme, S subunit